MAARILERVIGTIRHEYLDYVIVLQPDQLVSSFERVPQYYRHSRCYLTVAKNAEERPIQLPSRGRVHLHSQIAFFTIFMNGGRLRI